MPTHIYKWSSSVAVLCLFSKNIDIFVLILLFLIACIKEFVTDLSHKRSDSLIEGIGQRLHGVDWHQAMVSCGKHGAFPHVVLPCVPHHQQVILFK